ncbi:MAG: hypothetical protein H6601_03455 [Flavobacteriales bacterium]|nr:hypothetical protein [Flavobacteriales bacterium]
MRGALIVISLLFATVAQSQVWSDTAQYNAYMKGDWERVIELGKLAQKEDVDYYYIRARNGYANFMLGKYFKAEKEFEKALKFNSADPFSKRYGYWSSVYAGNAATALVKSSTITQSEKDDYQVIRQKVFRAISLLGGYRLSTTKAFTVDLPGQLTATVDAPQSMPYVSLFLNHQIGKRLTLNHGVSYLNQYRPGQPAVSGTPNIKVWQVGYLASLSIQAAKHTTITPSFVMQYWESGGSQVYDLSATIAVRQQFGNVSLTAIGGYFEDTDTAKFMAGASLTWYPLNNLKLYSITSGGYNFGKGTPNPFLQQTIGGNIFKRMWLRTSFIWNNRVVAFEDVGLDFANNSSDRLQWLWSISPSYFPIDKLSISLTYSVESRQFYLPGVANPLQVGEPIIGRLSDHYNFHSFYLGLSYNF